MLVVPIQTIVKEKIMRTENRNVTSNVKRTLLNIGIGVLGMLTVVSCDKDNSSPTKQGKVAISAKASMEDPNTKSSKTAKDVSQNIVLTDFLINVKEFELELDDDYKDNDNEQWDDDGFFGYTDDIELEGPFELELLKGTYSFINTDVPVGRYDKIEFEIDKNENPESALFGKSVLIKGTLDTTPFVFWHDFEADIEIEYEDDQKKVVIANKQTNLTLQFNLTQLLYGVGAIDFSRAVDGNNDGIIEISPGDLDGNQVLADKIKEKLKDIIDLLED